jgi:cytoskeleton protein RodZ
MPDQVDWRAMEREATPGRAVGRLLRDQREARGLTVTDIEKRLHIRKNHLEALESGRFDQLPGAAYIPAFLRAYAREVGLDAEKVLTAYHLSGPVPIKRPIALPADFPIVEKRAPIGLALITVLLVIGAGYGVWHYLPHPQSVVAEKVPPVPDRLLASVPPTSSAPQEPAASDAVNSEATKVFVPMPPPQLQPASGITAGENKSVARPETVAVPAAQPAPQPAPPVVVTAPAPPPPVVMSAPIIGQAQAAQPANEVQEARTAQPDSATPATPPVVPPVASVPSRVDTPLRLRSNSWVELRAPNGDILAMTYVRAGETYTVPAGIAYRIIDAH